MSSLIDKYSKTELEEIVSCSFSYVEVLSKLGYSTGHGSNYKTIKRRLKHYGISTEHFCHKTQRNNWTDEEIFCENSKVSQHKLRDTFYARNFVSYQCAVCGLPPLWNKMPLVLTLDHINGTNKDNRIENLRWLCPNCDRQSNTYGRKNKKKLSKGVVLYPIDNSKTQSQKLEKHDNNTKDIHSRSSAEIVIPNREELKNKLWELKNYTKVASFYNVSTTQIRRWCRNYKLPAVITIIKLTSESGWINENWSDNISINSLVEQSKPCYMLNKANGEILMEFPSRKAAGRYVAPNAKSADAHIGKVCDGLRKSAYGYCWKNKEV